MVNSYNTLLLLVIALVLSFSIPLKAQDTADDYLNAHNPTTVNVSPLIWSQTLAGYAQAYAAKRRDCEIILSGGPYGEAILSADIDFSAEQFVRIFFDEGSDYDYATNTCRAGKSCDGYKQILFRKSVSLGCAKVRCDNGGSFTICSYDPPVNLSERPF